MPPVDQDRDLAKLTRLRVLELDSTPQAKCLQLRWAYYQQAQHDGLGYDFDGRNRPANISYEEQRLRSLGWISVENATNPAGPPAAVTFGARRPDCPTTIAGYVVDTYTSMLLGEGREPAVRVVGDADSTAALNAMLDAGYAWDALQEVRKIAGAVGAAAILPEIINGELAFRALRPEDLYVEWDTSRDWVPRLVIEQRRVEVTGLDEDGQLTSSKVWRTRAWDQTYAYVYQDVPLDHGKAPPTGGPSQRGRASDEDSIELAEAPIAHKAGRCPVIWLQNTRCSDEPIGEADCGNVFELIDRLDRFESMILRGGTANLDPTLVISDKLVERRMQERRAKGYGQKIEVSESGKVHLLEMTGKTIEVAIVIADRIRHKIEMRTGVLVIQPDQAGAVASSGVALQLLRGTANNRVSARRPSLSRTIKQLGEVLLELAREWGIKLLGTDGPGIALPPREVPATEKGGEVTYEPHVLGSSRAIVCSWGDLHSPTPTDLQTTSQGLTMATGGQPVLSQETAVGLMLNTAQADVDVATELERIAAERAAKVASFESSMTPDADDELDGMLDGEDGEDEGEEEGEPMQDGVKAKDVQATALNGAQVTAFLELMSATGVSVAPGVSQRFQARAFQIPPDEAAANVQDQIAFLASKPREPGPNPTAAESPAAE